MTPSPHDKRMVPVLAAAAELETRLTALLGPRPPGWPLEGPRPAWGVHANHGTEDVHLTMTAAGAQSLLACLSPPAPPAPAAPRRSRR